MPSDPQMPQTLAMASLLAWASGLRLYLAVFALGLGGAFGYLDLPPGLRLLQHPAAFLAALALFAALAIWFLPRLWQAVAALWRLLRSRSMIGRTFRQEDQPR